MVIYDELQNINPNTNTNNILPQTVHKFVDLLANVLA